MVASPVGPRPVGAIHSARIAPATAVIAELAGVCREQIFLHVVWVPCVRITSVLGVPACTSGLLFYSFAVVDTNTNPPVPCTGWVGPASAMHHLPGAAAALLACRVDARFAVLGVGELICRAAAIRANLVAHVAVRQALVIRLLNARVNTRPGRVSSKRASLWCRQANKRPKHCCMAVSRPLFLAPRVEPAALRGKGLATRTHASTVAWSRRLAPAPANSA